MNQHMSHESVYDGLVEDHGDVSGQWAFGTSFHQHILCPPWWRMPQ